jgi:hypothetical protein
MTGERGLDGVCRAVGSQDRIRRFWDRPTVEPDDARRTSSVLTMPDRVSDLRKRAPRTADRDQRVAGQRDDGVTCLTESGRHDDVKMRISCRRIVAGKNTDDGATGRARAPSRRFHHAAVATANDDGSALGEQAPDFLGSGERCGVGGGRSADRDLDAPRGCGIGTVALSHAAMI